MAATKVEVLRRKRDRYAGLQKKARDMCFDAFGGVEPSTASVSSDLFQETVDKMADEIQQLCNELIAAYTEKG